MVSDKPKVVVTTAITREMVGFTWAIARLVTSPHDTSVRTLVPCVTGFDSVEIF
jgi:hypothetical protein